MLKTEHAGRFDRCNQGVLGRQIGSVHKAKELMDSPGRMTFPHTYSRELSNEYQQGLDGFQKSLLLCALDESSLSIGRVKYCHVKDNLPVCRFDRCNQGVLGRQIGSVHKEPLLMDGLGRMTFLTTCYSISSYECMYNKLVVSLGRLCR